jgi:proline iminopeptidase
MNLDKHTNQEFFLDAGDGHQVYVQDWGNPTAKMPIFFLHGGPGNGCYDNDKNKFDPQTQRVIFHDQRGSGRSLPAGQLEHNTTEDLVADINAIAKRLKIEHFIITGGSWGSTLALVFAITHPNKVTGLVIDGVFTASKEENEWFEAGGWREFFPDIWEEYQQTVPQKYRKNPSAYHYDRALHGTPEEVKKSSYDYTGMEIAILKLDERLNSKPYENFEPGGGLIEMYYLAEGCFIENDYIVKNASKLTMPVYIVQGRYDMVCRPSVAYRLHKALPHSKLIWTINGHSKQHEAKTTLALLLDRLTNQPL